MARAERSGRIRDALRSSTALSVRRSEIAAALLLLWSCLSLLWTPDLGQGMFQASHGLLAVLLYLVVARLPLEGIRKGLLPGVALSLLIHFFLLYELPTDWYGGFGNKNFGAEYVLGAIPLAAAAFWHTRLRYPGIVIALAGAVLLFTVYGAANAKYAAILALGLALAGYLIAKRRYLLASIIVLGPIDAAVLFGVNAWSLSSVRTRLEIWTNTLALWLEKPWFGHGFGSFNHEYPRLQEFHLGVFPEMGTLFNQPAMYSGAAHNDALQVLAELGIVGLVLALGFIVLLLRGRLSRKRLSPIDLGALACLCLLAGASVVGFPFQNPSTILLAVVSLGILARGEETIGRVKIPRLVAASMAAVPVVWLVLIGWQHQQSRTAFTQVRGGLEANDLAGAFVASLAAVQKFEWDWLPRFQLALTLTSVAVHDSKSVVEPRAADRIFEITRTASPHSPVSAYARVAYLEAAGRLEERLDEVGKIVDGLKFNASLQPTTWTLEEWYAARIGDPVRAYFAQQVLKDPRILANLGHEYPAAYKDHVTGKTKP